MSLLTTAHDPLAPILSPPSSSIAPSTPTANNNTPYSPDLHSLPSHSLQSPNAIPPRTSSTGISPLNHTPSKSVLRPVAEGDWIGSGRKRSLSRSPSPPGHDLASRFSYAPLDDITNLSLGEGYATGASNGHLGKAAAAVAAGVTAMQRGGIAESIEGNGEGYTSSAKLPSRSDENHHEPPPTLLSTATPGWSAPNEQILLGPYTYLSTHPGKDIRTRLISAFNAHLKVPPASLAIITRAIGMLHTASLLIDDVEDNSFLRRGIPVAHSIFGTAQTINSANYVYFQALQEVMRLGGGEGKSRGVRPVEIYTEELLNLHRGQGMDLYWRESGICPSEAEYLEMVGNKTGGLFRLAVKLMQAESECTKDFIPLTALISTLFQIRDDYSNLLSPSYTAHKGLAEDLTEGKFSFPIIHAIRTGSTLHSQELQHILRQHTENVEVKRYAVQLMESIGSFEYCREVLGRLGREARRVCEGLGMGEGDEVVAILDLLDV